MYLQKLYYRGKVHLCFYSLFWSLSTQQEATNDAVKYIHYFTFEVELTAYMQKINSHRLLSFYEQHFPNKAVICIFLRITLYALILNVARIISAIILNFMLLVRTEILVPLFELFPFAFLKARSYDSHGTLKIWVL